MKRALTAAVIGGVLMFLVPQAASAETRTTSRMSVFHEGEQGGGESAGQADKADEPKKADEPEKAPEHPQGDRESHDDDGTTLF